MGNTKQRGMIMEKDIANILIVDDQKNMKAY